jgi:hypothetical protein
MTTVRNAPQVRRSSHVSRVDHRALPPLKLLESSRRRPEWRQLELPAAALPDEDHEHLACLRLDSWLPINLRRFLIAELGPSLRFEEGAIFATRPGARESLMRELARAIRRYSFNRARETWNECLVRTSWLEAEFSCAPAEQHQVVLCLRCSTIEAGPDAAGRHQAAACLALTLNSVLAQPLGTAIDDAARALVRHGLFEVIERFRLGRTAASLPHFDLDCYMRNEQVAFTWRPMPAPRE